jgi:hypothetical protein
MVGGQDISVVVYLVCALCVHGQAALSVSDGVQESQDGDGAQLKLCSVSRWR